MDRSRTDSSHYLKKVDIVTETHEAQDILEMVPCQAADGPRTI